MAILARIRTPHAKWGAIGRGASPKRGSRGALLAAILVAAGCTSVKRTYQPEQDHGEMSDVGFIHYLSSLPMVTADEAYHAMLLLADGRDAGGDFEGRAQILQERGVVRSAWNLAPDDALDRGTMAFMLVKILRLKGGVNDVVLGSWGPGDRRYALRTAVWRGMVPWGPVYQVVTGGELVTAMTNADKYMELEGMYASQ